MKRIFYIIMFQYENATEAQMVIIRAIGKLWLSEILTRICVTFKSYHACFCSPSPIKALCLFLSFRMRFISFYNLFSLVCILCLPQEKRTAQFSFHKKYGRPFSQFHRGHQCSSRPCVNLSARWHIQLQISSNLKLALFSEAE